MSAIHCQIRRAERAAHIFDTSAVLPLLTIPCLTSPDKANVCE